MNSGYRVCERVSKTPEKKPVDFWESAGRDRNNLVAVKSIFLILIRKFRLEGSASL